MRLENNMTEPLIKLFERRSERYPEPTDGDVALGSARALIASLPWGGTINELLSVLLVPPVLRRRDQWFKELADAIEILEARNELRVIDLQDNDIFISAVIQATQAATSTHQIEKRRALRNAILNIAIGNTPGEDETQMFLRDIEELTSWHLKILKCLMDKEAENQFRLEHQKSEISNPSFCLRAERLLSLYPELKEHAALADQVVLDLFNRGLYPHQGLRGTMTAPPHRQTETRANEFIAFITSPI